MWTFTVPSDQKHKEFNSRQGCFFICKSAEIDQQKWIFKQITSKGFGKTWKRKERSYLPKKGFMLPKQRRVLNNKQLWGNPYLAFLHLAAWHGTWSLRDGPSYCCSWLGRLEMRFRWWSARRSSKSDFKDIATTSGMTLWRQQENKTTLEEKPDWRLVSPFCLLQVPQWQLEPSFTMSLARRLLHLALHGWWSWFCWCMPRQFSSIAWPHMQILRSELWRTFCLGWYLGAFPVPVTWWLCSSWMLAGPCETWRMNPSRQNRSHPSRLHGSPEDVGTAPSKTCSLVWRSSAVIFVSACSWQSCHRWASPFGSPGATPQDSQVLEPFSTCWPFACLWMFGDLWCTLPCCWLLHGLSQRGWARTMQMRLACSSSPSYCVLPGLWLWCWWSGMPLAWASQTPSRSTSWHALHPMSSFLSPWCLQCITTQPFSRSAWIFSQMRWLPHFCAWCGPSPLACCSRPPFSMPRSPTPLESWRWWPVSSTRRPPSQTPCLDV